MSSEHRQGLIWVILAATGYAFLPVFTNYIYRFSDLQPTDIGIWRFVFATPMIWLFILLRDRRDEKIQKMSDSPAQILKLMALGIFYAGAALSAFFGLQYIPASIFGIIFYTYPAIVALIAVFLGQRLAWAAWGALAITLVGVVLTVPDLAVTGTNPILGIGFAISNALFISVYFTLIPKVMKKTSSVLRGSAYVVTGTLLTMLLALPFFGFRFPPNLETWLLVLGLSTISTALPIAVINMGISKVGAAQASIISTFEPVLTMVLALIFLNEIILPMQWLGAALIIAGVIFLETRPRPQISS